MSVQLEGVTLPKSGRVDVDIHVSADIHVTATAARRRVSRLVISEIGNLLYGGRADIDRRRARPLARAGDAGLSRLLARSARWARWMWMLKPVKY